jgi:hypothetical protein
MHTCQKQTTTTAKVVAPVFLKGMNNSEGLRLQTHKAGSALQHAQARFPSPLS